jgi:CRISPR-associated protein Csd1
MSILASLARAYERLPGAPPYGYSSEKIGFAISLNEDGTVAHVIDLREGDGRRVTPRRMQVPQPAKRTVAIAPNFLWDRTSYVLGVTAGEGKRASEEHAAFVERHLEVLSETSDTGLIALRRFLEKWKPEHYVEPLWPEELKDQNVVFLLESDRLQNVYLHDRPAALSLWSQMNSSDGETRAVCLVMGRRSPVARLHPAIKGVWGAQSSGASIVSFNLDAFTSYGHEQGDNAPISEQAAFAYTTALNRFLEKGSRNRIQIGDASTVFWGEAPEHRPAAEAEGLFAAMFTEIDETSEAQKVGALLERIRRGQPLREVAPQLSQGVRFYVLGLAPNAARLSIRFWLEDDFGRIAENYQRFISDMAVEPGPRDPNPALWKYLQETAVQRKSDNVPPNLAGEWMRAILSGTTYPLTLLSTVLMRIRSDKEVNALRVGMLRALLVRNFGIVKEAPVGIDVENTNKGYLLGRLFAAYEYAQAAALGPKVNSTIKDKFYGAASAQPRKVFALLERGSANHLSKVGKERPGLRVSLERAIGAIMEQMSPTADPFPASLSAQEQALFGLGYYHQRNEFFKSRKVETVDEGETE